MLQDAVVDGESSSPSQTVSSHATDASSSPAQWRANLRKMNSVGGSGVDGSTDDLGDTGQLSRSSSLSTDTPVYILPTFITYFCFNGLFPCEPGSVCSPRFSFLASSRNESSQINGKGVCTRVPRLL